MSLVDDVLAEHTARECDVSCCSNRAHGICTSCGKFWPCEIVRLALSLRAAEKVVEDTRKLVEDNERRGLHGAHVLKAKMRLAEYDKGGRG